MKREWKGVPRKLGLCGAEVKLGMMIPEGVRCELPRNHIGFHRNGTMTWGEPKPDSAPKKDAQ